MSKHSFCAITRFCTRCGIAAEAFAAQEQVPPCWPSDKVVSLDWWKHLKAHERLSKQLVASVAAGVTGAMSPQGD